MTQDPIDRWKRLPVGVSKSFELAIVKKINDFWESRGHVVRARLEEVPAHLGHYRVVSLLRNGLPPKKVG